MTIRTLFNIILKIVGLMFLNNIVIACVALIGTLFFWGNQYQERFILEIMSRMVPIVLHVLAAWFLIFRSDKIVDSMKLQEDLGIDLIPINMHRSTVLSIVIIVIGGLMLVDEIPNLMRQAYMYYRKSEAAFGSDVDISYIVFSIFKIIIALLLLGNQRKLVSLIEIHSRQAKR